MSEAESELLESESESEPPSESESELDSSEEEDAEDAEEDGVPFDDDDATDFVALVFACALSECAFAAAAVTSKTARSCVRNSAGVALGGTGVPSHTK